MKRYPSLTVNPATLVAFAFSLGMTAACSAGLPSQNPAHTHPAVAEPVSAPKAVVIAHQDLKTYENNGNELVGIATQSLGANNFEVWRTSVAPGSATPPHLHSTEEIFIFLQGRGRATIGDETIEFTAPATVIAPAGVMHQFFNTGDIKTDAIVVVGVGSHIHNAEGQEMILPWRK